MKSSKVKRKQIKCNQTASNQIPPNRIETNRINPIESNRIERNRNTNHTPSPKTKLPQSHGRCKAQAERAETKEPSESGSPGLNIPNRGETSQQRGSSKSS